MTTVPATDPTTEVDVYRVVMTTVPTFEVDLYPVFMTTVPTTEVYLYRLVINHCSRDRGSYIQGSNAHCSLH